MIVKTRKFKIAIVVIVFLVLPIFLNIIITIGELANFGGFDNAFEKAVYHGVFYLANWAPMVCKVYPCVIGIDGVSIYHALGWLKPHIFIFNSLMYGLIGFVFGNIMFPKGKPTNPN